MDILTERGQIFQGHADHAVRVFEACYGQRFGVALTDWKKPIALDGFMIRKDTRTIMAGIEIKSRDMSLDDLRQRYQNQWLISFDKILAAKELVKPLAVPVIGWLYTIRDDRLSMVELVSETGELKNIIKIEQTKTQATCNGGEAHRWNAFIDMSKARTANGTRDTSH